MIGYSEVKKKNEIRSKFREIRLFIYSFLRCVGYFIGRTTYTRQSSFSFIACSENNNGAQESEKGKEIYREERERRAS